MLSEDTADRLMERTAAMYAVSAIKPSKEPHTSRYHCCLYAVLKEKYIVNMNKTSQNFDMPSISF